MQERRELLNKETIERVKGDNCFDFLRYFFAFSLIIVHFCTLVGIEQFWFVNGQTRVKAFFTITGFLVVYSYVRRKDIKIYAWKRILRIVPAYVTVVLCCFLAGALFTTLPVGEYLSAGQTYRYLAANLSFLNFLEPSLPGLFTNNSETAVNGSLWSMKFEVLFYALVPLVVWLMKRYKRTMSVCIVVCFALYHFVLDYLEDSAPDNPLYYQLNHGSFNTMMYFFTGCILLVYFDVFCRHIRLILPASIALLVVYTFFDIPLLNYVEPLVFSAFIIGVAYFAKPLNFLRRYDNISYGLYLYHFPVIQLLIQFGLPSCSVFLTFVVAVLITIIFSLLSWKIVEKPMLQRIK